MPALDTSLPPALFELEELGLRIVPTIAMRNGQQAVFQCAQCGLVAVQTNLAHGPLGACPACHRDAGWHRQQLPVAGLHDQADEPPPIFEGAILTPYGRHHGLGPGIFATPMCGAVLYDSIEPSNRRAWIYHACSLTGEHDQHKCDRCDTEWEA